MKTKKEMILKIKELRQQRKFCDFVCDFAIDEVLARETPEKLAEDKAQAVFDAVNNGFIYGWQEWELLKAYQTPQTADFDEAENIFINDLLTLFGEVLKEEGTDNENK